MTTADSRSPTISDAAEMPSRFGILMSRMATSGRSSRTSDTALVPVARLADHLISLFGQGLDQVEPDDRFVLGYHHAHVRHSPTLPI